MENNSLALVLLFTAVALTPLQAGTEWISDQTSDKCPIEKCEDIGASISVGYDTDYMWKGVRWARDSVWSDVNYTFEELPFSPNIGIWYLSSLGSGGPRSNDAFGDEFDIYTSISLPELAGFDTGLGYTWFTYPNTPGNPISTGIFNLSLSRELVAGIELGYLLEYYTGQSFVNDWFHTLTIARSFELTDRLSLELSGEVGYTDDFWQGGQSTPSGGSGWNHWGVRATLPIALNSRTTLTPYIAYNGTPDSWKADHFEGIGNLGGGSNQGANANDVLYGGISLGVDF